MTDLRQAAQAVIDRWDSPLWKNGSTADAIADLRTALEQQAEPVTCGYDETTGNCTRELCCCAALEQQQAEPVAQSDLVKRLRETASKGVSVWGNLQMEAAREIEILRAERDCYASAMDKMLAASRAEPVAWIAEVELSVFARTPKEKTTVEIWKKPVLDSDVAIYTAPLQQQAEPVAWNWMQDENPCSPAYFGTPPDKDIAQVAAAHGKTVRMLYTTPPQRKPLTGEEITNIVREVSKGSALRPMNAEPTSVRIARAIEAAHGIKEGT